MLSSMLIHLMFFFVYHKYNYIEIILSMIWRALLRVFRLAE
jgi:hypothetical protein